ncbi:MAG: dephospho-CoA kinase [Flavobacteriales bacterium]|nr:dephospho-CoA kinase [Flavobacteriales bacterium]
MSEIINMKKIGITGGIGVGKTYVSDILRKLDYPVYNSDEVSKKIMNTNLELIQLIKNEFGEDIYASDNKLNSSRLSSLVFSDRLILTKINSIVHPFIFDDFKLWCLKQSSSIVFKEAAILFESGANNDLDAVICISADDNLRIERIKKRDGRTEEDIRLIISSQIDQVRKEEMSDYKIINDGKTSLLMQINEIIEDLE